MDTSKKGVYSVASLSDEIIIIRRKHTNIIANATAVIYAKCIRLTSTLDYIIYAALLKLSEGTVLYFARQVVERVGDKLNGIGKKVEDFGVVHVSMDDSLNYSV